MRKITFLWIFLLQGILVTWAQEKISTLPAIEMKGILAGTPQEKVKAADIPGAMITTHRIKTNAPTVSASDFEGTYMQISEDRDGTETGYALEISATDNTTLSISNFWNGDKTIKAILHPEDNTIKIDPQEISVHPTYGSIFIYSYDFKTNTYNPNVPVMGIVKDGVITFDSWIALINEGEYKSYSLGIYKGSELTLPNSNMTETSLTSKDEEETLVYPILLKQINANTLAMYNTSNIGVKIDIQLNPDRTFTIPPQVFLANSLYGSFICYPLKKVSGTNPQFDRNQTITGKTVGSDLSWENWGVYSPSSGMLLGVYKSSVLNTLLEIDYPKPVEANFEGKGTPESPYLIKTMEDLYILSETVNADKTLVDEHTSSYAGKYFRLETDLDASTLTTTLHPIGCNATQRFAGVFDGNNKTIRNLTMKEGMGYSALFGNIGSEGVVKNLRLENYTCETLGYYGAGIAGYAYGRIENCQVEGTIFSESTYSGGIAGYSDTADIINCSFKGTMTGGDYMGGIVGTSFGNIRKCWADATITFANTGSFTSCGGITSAMYGTKADIEISDCYFTGQIKALNNEYTVGGIAGCTKVTKIVRCFNTGTITGTGASVNMGGILGYIWDSTVQDCYNSGMIADAYSERVSGIVGNTLDMKEEEKSLIENCYNTGIIYTKSKEESCYIIGRTLPAVTIKNSFYDQQILAVPSTTYGISTAQLTDAKGIKDFDASVWNFTAGHYPRLKGIDENNAAYLSAACLSLDKMGTAKEVRRDFTLTTDNQIQWKAVLNEYFGNNGHGFSIEGNKGVLNGEVTQDTIFAFNADNKFKYYILSISPVRWKGEGTADDPFLIGNKEDMMNLAVATNDAKQTFNGSHFKMTADIDMEYDENFTGLGKDNTGKIQFGGIFDGNGHTLSKIKINSIAFDDNGKINTNGSRKFTGFIGCLAESGVIRNLTIAPDCDFNMYSNAGAIAGYSYGLIENCKNYATVKGYMNYIGGIVGYNGPSGRIRNCFNSGTIYSGSEAVGGITGASNGIVESCQNTGLVSALPLSITYKAGSQGSAGGIAGLNSGIIRNVLNTGKVATYDNVSGIVGGTQKVSGSGGSVINAINYGEIEIWYDRSTSGQIIGDNSGATETTNNYYDIQIQALAAVNNQKRENNNGVNTKDLIAGKLALPDSAWIQKENMYPMLIAFKNEPQAQLDARAAIVLDTASSLANISKEGGKLQNSSEIQWQLTKKAFFRIEEGTLRVTMPTDQVATDTLVATYNNVKRMIPIRALYNILEGKGTQEEPWLIRTPNDMAKLSDFVHKTGHEYRGEYFKVMEDLDFEGMEYTPVAFENKIFQGYFDGNGKTLKNITYAIADSTTVQERGLFGVVGADGTIANLTLSNCKFQTYKKCGAFAGGLYGKIINCVNDHTDVLTTGLMYAGGIAGFGYDGASIENCKNSGNVTAGSVGAGGMLGSSEEGQLVKILSCSNEGTISVKSSQAGGIVGRAMAYISDCHNTANIKISSSNAGGIAGNLLTGSYVGKCYNTASIISNTFAGGIVETVGNHTTDAPFILEDCYNTGEVSTTYTLKSTTYAGGIAGKTGNASIVRNCYNKAPILANTSYAGGIVGTIAGTVADPSRIEDCYNAKEGLITANESYAGGIAGSAANTILLRTYNEADITAHGNTALNYTGGIVGNCTGSVEKSWNSGTITVEFGLAGGIAGNGTGTIDRCYNRGEVISQGTVAKKSVSAGGILGKGKSALTNCYNAAKVSGLSEVGGIIGTTVAGTKTETGTSVTACYNLGEVAATSADSLGNIVGLAAKFTEVSSSFYDKNLCNTYVLDTCATALTTAEMVEAPLGDAFKYSVATYPRIDAFENDAAANFHAALILFAEGDEMNDVKKPIQIGTPEGVEWTTSSNLAIDGNTVTLKNSVIGEEAVITLTAGDLQRAYKLILNGKPVGIGNTEASKVIMSRTYYTTDGIRVAEPVKGRIIIEKRIYDDGTSETVKVWTED